MFLKFELYSLEIFFVFSVCSFSALGRSGNCARICFSFYEKNILLPGVKAFVEGVKEFMKLA